jgi:hypothetical protein
LDTILDEIKVLSSIIGEDSTRLVLAAFLQEVGPAAEDAKLLLFKRNDSEPIDNLRAALHKLRGLLASVRALENEHSVAQIQEMVKKRDFASAREIFDELDAQLATTKTAVNHYLSESATP